MKSVPASSSSKSKRGRDLWRSVEGMQHRRPSPDCPLCPLWGVPWVDGNSKTHRRQHSVAEEFWAAWDGSTGWERRVQQVAAVHEVTASVEQVRKHFSAHRIEQPYLSRRSAKAETLAELSQMSDKARALLTSVYRQRMLTREQAIEIFFAGSHRSRKAAEVEADRMLTHLARRHFLYRWYPPTQWPKTLHRPSDGFFKSVAFFPGRALQSFAEQQSPGPVWPENFVGLARQVGLATLPHDIACSQLFVDLAKALRLSGGQAPLAGHEHPLTLSLPTANWYGSRQVRFVFYDERRSCDVDMKPDGFATLAVHRSGYDKDGIGPCLLPFAYEVDRGTKGEIDVAEQMIDYHRLAISGAVGKRFPELHVPGYAVPMIMLFPDRKRLEAVVRSFLRQAAKEHLTTGAPILVGVNSEWSADPFAVELVHAWDGRTFSLLDALLRSSRRLREVGSLLPRDVLSYSYATQVRRELRKPLALPPEDEWDEHPQEQLPPTQHPMAPAALSPASFAGLYGDHEQTTVPSLPEWAEPRQETSEVELPEVAERPEVEPSELIAPTPIVQPQQPTPSQPSAPPRRRSADTGRANLFD